MMRGTGAAKRYANALLEVGIAHGKLDEIRKQVEELANIYESSQDFQRVISNPSVAIDERQSIVRAIAAKANWDTFVKNFALTLIDNNRFEAVSQISHVLNQGVDEHRGDLRAFVTTAKAMKDSQVAVVQGALAKMTGKNIILDTAVDPSLIGGIVTRIGNKVYDGSVRTKLSSLKESILKDV